MNPAVWVAVPFGLALLAFALLFFERERASILATGTIVIGFCLGSLALAASWAWVSRDGMGPNSVESHGLVAIGRFWAGFCVPFVLCAGVAVGAVALSRNLLRRA